MEKISSKAILFLFLALICSAQRGYSAEETPEQFIKRFYTWYITVSEGRGLALENDDIYTYVADKTVKEVRAAPCVYGSDRRDYFLKVSDTPLDMSGIGIDIGKVTNMGMDTFVAPVVITSTFSDGYQARQDVVVILKRIEGSLKITKCVDIYPEA